MNLAVVGSCTNPPLTWPILAGAILPDVPIILLYARERLRGTTDDVIWAFHYQQRLWQNVVHGLHSIPLAGLGLVVSLALGAPQGAALFGSALLHALSDLPVHGEDAHRHFLPLSQYRFISPISYWDVRLHARWVALGEALGVLLATTVIWAWPVETWARAVLVVVNAWYAFNYWRSYLRAPAKTVAP